jgi:glycosidase
LDAYFAFEVSDAIPDAVRTGSAAKLFPAVVRAQRDLPAGRWSPFLRNHDQTRTLTALGGDVAGARLAATLLLTFPGLPFVYYGEEIGMTGDKPDPRLRTPMQWSRAPGAGFTRGTPWEALQPDSLTATVEAGEADSMSLLNLHRRLIRLRAETPALGEGELVPLETGRDAVAAYLRRVAGESRAVLVIVNLGTTPLSGVTVTSRERVLPAGRYAPRGLLVGAAPVAAPLRVGSDGRIRRWVPLPTLAPRQGVVLELK